MHIEIQNLMKDSFIHQRDSFLEAKDFVINEEVRRSIGRNDPLLDKYQTAAESRTNEGLRCLSPSSSGNYFKNNSKSAMGFAGSKPIKKKRQHHSDCSGQEDVSEDTDGEAEKRRKAQLKMPKEQNPSIIKLDFFMRPEEQIKLNQQKIERHLSRLREQENKKAEKKAKPLFQTQKLKNLKELAPDTPMLEAFSRKPVKNDIEITDSQSIVT